ncbi:MAG: hypothetical protein ABJA34_10100 [Pseudonocardiales bacterium]
MTAFVNGLTVAMLRYRLLEAMLADQRVVVQATPEPAGIRLWLPDRRLDRPVS